jgi:hypothetical protein
MQRSFELFAEIERGYALRIGLMTYRSMKHALQILAAPVGIASGR